ncbi:hypothetical protein [Spirosoma aerolatum]|uniref:hypothetical protein n=1 Tax=Spirosoma aerolatum TaxID=1211326 RepID=UPI0009AC6039|nr:hypothetical protein [Spirosoma aerolatum]
MDTVKQGVSRNLSTWQSIKDPDDKRCRLIRYDTLADKYKIIVRRVLCNGLEPWEVRAQKKTEVLSERSLSELLELVLKDGYRRYMGLYPAEDTTRIAERKQKCLARAAATVELIGTYIREREIKESSYAPYKEVVEWLNQDGNYDFYFPKGCQYLPCNEIRLKEKVTLRFGKVGKEPVAITEVIKRPREGNKSRDKFAGDAELMAWIAIARANVDNSGTPNAYIIRKIQDVCRIVGKDVPSNSWLSQVLVSGKMQYMTAPTRFGKGTKQASRFVPYISMARAMYAGDCWMMDATRVNFIEHATSDKDKPRFLFVVVVRDAYSGDVVGCYFDTKEDRWGYVNALKMAYKSTGYLPHTLVHDRFPGHLADEMQSVLDGFRDKGVELICTHEATGKALLERWFDTLQTVFLTRSRYYYGQGIRSTRPYNHRSPEYLAKMRKRAKAENWDFEAAWQEAWRRIEEYRQTPISYYSRKRLDLSPMQLHEQSEKPHVIRVEGWQEATLFWATKVLDISRARIEQEVHGKVYRYMIYDENILYAYKRVAIRYEESDPSKVMLFAVGADDRVTDFFIDELTHTDDIVMYGPDAQKGRLAGRMEKNKQLQERIRKDLEETVSHASMDPEYVLAMRGLAPKDEIESVQDAILYEQMGVSMAMEAQRPAAHKRDKIAKSKASPVPSSEGVIDPKSFVNNSYFNQ